MTKGGKFRKSQILGAVLVWMLTPGLHGQVIPPGVPEPGLVLWGTVVNQTNGQPITINSVRWSVTDGSKAAVYSSASRPATRIVSANGQSYYVLQVPFDTRQIGSVVLADPLTVGINSFPLTNASPPTYLLVGTINGALATVRSIDSAPATGTNVPVAGFTSAIRGRVIRADLGIVPVLEDYDTWAARFFGSVGLPQAARTADPDGDGMTNEAEHAAGTDPTDPNSALRILALQILGQPPQASIQWRSAADRTYIIESAAAPQGPWTGVGSLVPTEGAQTDTAITVPPGEPQLFYRVRLAP
jgi:hypothetical protein